MQRWPGIGRLLATASLLCACVGPVCAATIDADSIWNGHFVPGRPVELAIDGGHPDAGAVTVTVVDTANPSIRHRRSTDPSHDVATDVRVPLPVLSQPRLEIERRLDRSPESADAPTDTFGISLEPLPRDRPVVVVVGATLGQISLPGASIIGVAARSLPHYAQSYRFLDALVVDRRALDDTSTLQREALREFAAQCGRILLNDPGSAAILRAAAGCNGRTIVEMAPGSDVGRLLQDLLQTPVDASPPAGAIEALVDAPAAAWRSTTGVLTMVYVASMAALLLCGASVRLLLAAPTIGATLTAFTLSGVTPDCDRVRWAEVDGASGVATAIGLVRVIGNGQTRATIELPGAPLRIGQDSVGSALAFDYQRDTPRAIVETRLHSQLVMTFWARVHAPDLTLAAVDGVPVVTNAGMRPSGPVVLAWRDTKYRVPALLPTARWQPSTDAVVEWMHTPAEQLFRARAERLVAALLIEDIVGDAAEHRSSRDYTMVKL